MAKQKPTKAIYGSNGLTRGRFRLGKWGEKPASVKQATHDGDTVSTSTPLNVATRFLGMDAPEISFPIRTRDTFVSIGSQKWKDFWTSGEWTKMPLFPPLLAHLEARIGRGTKVAENHERWAKAAEDGLEDLIEKDRLASGKGLDAFEFFLAFAREVIDVYGRMLCYLHAHDDNFAAGPPAERRSYNERLLGEGLAVPYFIFPNLDPFLFGDPFDPANLAPAGFWKSVNKAKKLQAARKAVADARSNRSGVFDPSDRLILLPYEIRFLARKGSKGPERFVIDLGSSGGNTILRPEEYYSIGNLEDRLFVPKELVPLFTVNGWKVK